MVNERRRILILSYTFPPEGGIGGRRWAKFAKYLQRAGVDVSVIAANTGRKQDSPWTTDIEGLKVKRFRSAYPTVLGTSPGTFFDKLQYRWSLFVARQRSKGSPYDKAIGDRKHMTVLFEAEMHTFQPHVVIATGAPFLLLSFIAEMRSMYPSSLFIADFRDPWTWGETFGYRSLSSRRLAFELRMEAKVIEAFNVITSPWPSMIDHLKLAYPKSLDKFHLLSHAYDTDDLPPMTSVPQIGKRNRKRIIYGGSLYAQVESECTILAQFIAKHQGDFQWDIYSDSFPRWLESGPSIKLHPSVASRQFLHSASTADWLLLLIPDLLKDGVPTKVLEFLAIGKPVLIMGASGKLSQFVMEFGSGLLAENESDLAKILFSNFEPSINKSRLATYRYDKQTEVLLGIVKDSLKAE